MSELKIEIEPETIGIFSDAIRCLPSVNRNQLIQYEYACTVATIAALVTKMKLKVVTSQKELVKVKLDFSEVFALRYLMQFVATDDSYQAHCIWNISALLDEHIYNNLATPTKLKEIT